MKIDILDFLLRSDIVMNNYETGKYMTADEVYVLGGEFVVYSIPSSPENDYRTSSFEDAVKALNTR